MNKLNRKLLKYGWVYEREDGDRGIVLAKSREEAIDKLMYMYPDTRDRVAMTDVEGQVNDWMYLYGIDEVYNGYGQGVNDIFIVEPW